ncbi:hypothetical protein KIPB_011025 [Kipferlia bialata]|uniref:Uncharacterized protein n=1 Tax=Kipferlia bialata TaxID=797122 RepID=A0A391NZ81_9EUKA|nr:hypothetical protein KIPB_011025 [Kipferlia bialata]|eukprot:g11025.t1
MAPTCITFRLTVDPTSAEITAATMVVGPSQLELGYKSVRSCLVGGYNHTIQVSITSGMTEHALRSTTKPLEVRVFYPDTGHSRQIVNIGGGNWPEPRYCGSVGVVGGTLVVVSGFSYSDETDRSRPDGTPIHDMWCLDIQSRDPNETWRRQSIPFDAMWGFRNLTPAAAPVMVSSVGDSLMSLYSKQAYHLSFTGQIRQEAITYVGKVPPHISTTTIQVDIGLYICMFKTERYTRPTDEANQWRHLVFMYDRVSGDAILCESLPFPEEVTCACMPNPTTMIVVQEERLLLVELDPELFNTYTDVD